MRTLDAVVKSLFLKEAFMRNKYEPVNQLTNNKFSYLADRTRRRARPRKFRNVIERDLYAMRQVLKIMKEGTIRWIGEVGRQY